MKLASFEKPRHRSSSKQVTPVIPDQAATKDTDSGRDAARGPTFRVRQLSAAPALATAELVHINPSTGYYLAQYEEGCVVWPGAIQFDVPNCLAAFTDPADGASEPGLVVCDRETGFLAYWEALGSAVAGDVLNHATKASTELNLVTNEHVVALEVVPDIGFVVASSSGKFWIITMRDGRGHLALISRQMGHHNFITSIFLSGQQGWRRDIAAIRADPFEKGVERDVAVVSHSGDFARWRIGPDGQAVLVSQLWLHSLVVAHIGLLYPNSTFSLVFHDVQITKEGQTIVLASFFPDKDSSQIYYVLACFDGEQCIWVHRLQTYTSLDRSGRIIATEKQLFAVFPSAVVALNPKPPREEEIFSINEQARVLGMEACGSALWLAVSAPSALLEFLVEGPASDKCHLEQFVFYGRPKGLLRFDWPVPAETAREVASEIAHGRSQLMPRPASLSLRARLLARLTHAPIPNKDEVERLLEKVSCAQVLQTEDIDNVPSILGQYARDSSHRSIVVKALEAADPGPGSWIAGLSNEITSLAVAAAEEQDSATLATLIRILGSCQVPIDFLLARLAPLDDQEAVNLAEKFNAVQSLAVISCDRWLVRSIPIPAEWLDSKPGFSAYLYDHLVSTGKLHELVSQFGKRLDTVEFLKSRNLARVAWVLDFSVDTLKMAVSEAKSKNESKLFLSLARLAGDDTSVELIRVSAEEAVEHQAQLLNAPGPMISWALQASSLIDSLIFMPISVPGSETNLIFAARLVSMDDRPRIRVLAQKLACITDWTVPLDCTLWYKVVFPLSTAKRAELRVCLTEQTPVAEAAETWPVDGGIEDIRTIEDAADKIASQHDILRLIDSIHAALS